MDRRRAGSGRALVTIMLAAVLAAAVSGRTGPPTVRAQPAEDPALLRELVARLLSPPFPGSAGEGARVQLFPGALPPDLPLDLPTPPGGRLIGSVVRPSFTKGPPGPAQGQSITILLDAPGRPREVLSFFGQALEAQGWTDAPHYRPGGGFVPTSVPQQALYCQGENGPFLSALVLPGSAEMNDVRLTLETGGAGPCGAPLGPPGVRPGPPPGADLIPALSPPPGVRLLSTGGSGGGFASVSAPPGPGGDQLGFWSSNAIAETEMSVADLEAAFAAQLADAGWTRVDGGAQGPLAWSTWLAPGDEEWHGFLSVIDGPGPNRRSLHVDVASAQPVQFPFGK